VDDGDLMRLSVQARSPEQPLPILNTFEALEAANFTPVEMRAINITNFRHMIQGMSPEDKKKAAKHRKALSSKYHAAASKDRKDDRMDNKSKLITRLIGIVRQQEATMAELTAMAFAHFGPDHPLVAAMTAAPRPNLTDIVEKDEELTVPNPTVRAQGTTAKRRRRHRRHLRQNSLPL
jgi:hypothetical protein